MDLDSLKRENIRLKNEAEAREDIRKIGIEREGIRRENIKLKNWKMEETFKKVGKIGKAFGKAATHGGKILIGDVKKYNKERLITKPKTKFSKGMKNISKNNIGDLF
jgi:hypothetical protein